MIYNRNEQFETNKMKTLILNARIVNENDIKELDLLIENGLITQIEKDLDLITLLVLGDNIEPPPVEIMCAVLSNTLSTTFSSTCLKSFSPKSLKIS